MAHRYVALLRGINVGKAKRIAMADLRALVESLGYTEVATLLNSGNVVFSGPAGASAAAGAGIEAGIVKLGVPAKVVVFTAAEVDAAIAENPADPVPDPSRFLVAFLARSEDRAKLAGVLEKDWAPERFALGSRTAYLLLPSGIIDSPVAGALAKAMKDGVTSRNWATVLKIRALLAAA